MAIFFMPFTNVFTINLKFPLKIYEILLSILVLYLIPHGKIFIAPWLRKEQVFLFIFLFVLSCITLYRILYPPSGLDTQGFIFRFGPVGDSLSKILYLFFTALSYLLVSVITYLEERKVIMAWLLGAYFSSLYTWYLFLSSLLGLPTFLFPGTAGVQKFTYLSFSFIRSGTFSEGNFMGLYLLISIAIALYNRKYKTALFLTSTVLITFSTINFLALLFFWLVFGIKKFLLEKSEKKFTRVIVCLVVVLVVFTLLFKSKYLELVLFSKIFGVGNDILSKLDRINLIITGIKMFLDHPIIGVGLARYGYYFRHYQFMDIKDIQHYFKIIPNNIYVELLSELGIAGFITFMFFIIRIYKSSFFSSRYGFA
ncbi:MAG: O-antigen ligase family protein [Candidatus Omnitrophica bacterium]|nr:O-antigen ligase family protein [Candidatus Omnitrophota bacterium]